MNLRRSDTLQNFREIGGLNYEKMSSVQQQVTNIERKINQIKKKNDKMIKYLLFKKKKKKKKVIFYKRYVYDTYIRRKKNVNDELFQNFNSYHTNIKLTLEENPGNSLDTEIIRKKNTISNQVFTKLTKFPVH